MIDAIRAFLIAVDLKKSKLLIEPLKVSQQRKLFQSPDISLGGG